MKVRIDKVTGGKVRLGGGIVATEVSTTEGARINADGTIGTAASTGAHVREWSINKDGAQCSVTYYKPNATGSLCVAYYDASGSLIDGIASGTGSGRGQINTETVSLPTGTRTVRVFSIRSGSISAEAALSVLNTGGVYNMVEIKVRRPGASYSQVVWPTVTTYRLVSGTAHVVFSSGNRLSVMGNNYAQVVADIEVLRGSSVIDTLHNQVMEPVFSTSIHYITIDGVYQPVATIVSDTEIHAPNFKTTEFGGLTFQVRGVFAGVVTERLNIYLEENAEHFIRWTNDTVKGYRIAVDDDELGYSGGTVHVSGYIQKEHTAYNYWDSGEHTYGAPTPYETAQAPSSISVSPNTGVTVSGTAITFPQNTTASEISYTISATWSSYTSVAYVRVQGTSTGRQYSNLSIQSYTYPTYGSGSNAYSIPASGGGVYPTVTVRVYCSVNGDTAKLLSGTATGGALVCEVSGGGVNATVALSYLDYENGYVSAPSRGTNEDADRTVVASSIRVRASIGSLSVTSTYGTIYQQRNQKSVYSQGSYTITSMSVTPKVGGSDISGPIPARSTTVTLKILVSGNGTTTRYSYTSGAYSGGDTVTDTDRQLSQTDLASLSVTSGGSAVTVSNLEFTASNQHNLTAKTYSISATYEGTTRTATVQQAADAKKDGSATPSITLALSSNNLTAGGGYIDLIATAYSTAGKVWESDGTPVSGESSTTDNTSSVLLDITQSSQGAFPSVTPIATDTTNHTKTFRISHRDMTNNITTDTISVTARNGSAQSSALSYSVSNALETTEYEEEGTVVWGTTYTEIQEYLVSMSIGAFTSPDSPAPSNGGSTTYSVSARHRTNDYRDGTVTINYYRRYTSWSAEKDDASHKELVRTEYDTTTYAHQFVPNSQRIVTGDSAAISVVGGTPSWLQITPTDATHGTIQFSAQSVDNAVRYVTIRATHADDATAYAQSTVWQQAYQSLTASPLQYQFGWRGTDSAIIDVDARYVTWRISLIGGWIAASISTDGGITYVTADESTLYGSTSGLAQAKLKLQSLGPNDPDHNPTGYSQIRIGAVNLTPDPAVSGVNTVRLNITQEAYGGGLPTDE